MFQQGFENKSNKKTNLSAMSSSQKVAKESTAGENLRKLQIFL